MFFRNYRLWKTWLNHSLESAVSEFPWIIKILMGVKHFWNLHESTFIKFLDHSERKWPRKDLPYWNLKSKRCLLTHWLTMRTIPLGILGICSCPVKCKYLKNKKLFVNFIFHLWNLHEILNIFEKKLIVLANIFRKL